MVLAGDSSSACCWRWRRVLGDVDDILDGEAVIADEPHRLPLAPLHEPEVTPVGNAWENMHDVEPSIASTRRRLPSSPMASGSV